MASRYFLDKPSDAGYAAGMEHVSPPLPLTRQDVMDMEALLCEQLARLFAFEAHALHFPTGETPREPRLLPGERRLLLPLWRQESPLGILVLAGVRTRTVRPLLPFLPAVAGLCLDNMARARALRTDAGTGLATEAELFGRMESAASQLRAFLEAPSAASGASAPLHRLCMGLVLLRLVNGDSVVRRGGHAFAGSYLRALAEACREELPPDVLAARVGRWDFALLLPTSGRGACQALAENALGRMAAVRMRYPLLDRPVQARLCAGHALYPQDMLGAELQMEMFDQARRCMERARLAADVAAQAGGGSVMPFARILQEGGVVLETLPMGRVRLSLGRRAKAREGMRFAVWSREGDASPRYRGEVVILRTRDTDSVAEALHLADAARPPEAGDSLVLLDAGRVAGTETGEGMPLPERASITVEDVIRQAQAATAAVAEQEEDRAGAVRGHGAFLNRFARESAHCRRFVLAVLRVETARQASGLPPGSAQEEAPLDRALGLWRESAGNCGEGTPMAGLYGSNGLIFFHPGMAAEALVPLYAALSGRLRQQGLPAAVGLAGYPLLRFARGEILECALKALEYARLLPEPHVGVCDSLALNISADKRYSLGDVFGAVEEYKLALLADKNNAMAWNSLGVCMAALGRGNEARRHFLAALRHHPTPSVREQACYNLGTLCQGLGERRAAARYYRKCIELSPQHLFAHIRLGQMCEAAGRRAEARRWYERAAAIEDARPGSPSIARRHLARVAVRQRRGREARELLHEALLRNPGDAAAMLLLANIYLDGGEDPAVAELLARKSAGLSDRPEAWQTLARALRALGRDAEAASAETRAVAT